MSESAASAARYEFQAEVRQLLDILSHSLYTHRDVFIRELISNASDALDKARFLSVKNEPMCDADLPFEIRIDLDEKKKTFTISDTGIGMTRQELIDNLGIIARSGTAEFLKQLAKDSSDLSLIGRFGVGFYSVFVAAARVEVISKSAKPDEPAWQWSSDGGGTFEIAPAPEGTRRGTRIIAHLRPDAEEFAQKWKVQAAIEKYSNFVPFPIFLNGEQVNKITAVWREPKSSVSKEQYQEFFKFIAHQEEPPLTWLHFSADAPIQFHALLFVPKTNMELFGLEAPDEGLHLFVRRVLIDAKYKELLPKYLRFLRGVVESDDLPLNISRETLQENPHLAKIKSTLVSRLLSHFQELAKNEPETYAELWKQHGRILKEGYNDFANKDKLAALFRFNSSKCASSEELISLEEYVRRKHPEQKEIYYLSGPDRKTIENQPALEIFKVKDVEILYCYEPIDEFALPGLIEFEKLPIVSADTVDPAKLDKIPFKEGAGESQAAADERSLDKLARRIKDILTDRVEDVKLSGRLINSPAVLISQGISS
ncbi:MAG: molecular chaperone HtpG, partial [candidate division KSB1 bacterium]|nr:molecular chaperone HtpG [candidate division KSB1 bacterium]